MDKNSLLKAIAIKGYDAGFGAKKHFSTFDLACEAPNIIAVSTLTAGVIQLGFDIPGLTDKILSVLLIFIGIVAIFINQYGDKKLEYVESGVKINKIYQDLRNLYLEVQGTDSNNEKKLDKLEQEYKELIRRFNEIGITQQMMFSDWYAHYKFFVQLETKWIEEQRPFNFKDKIPLALRWVLYLIVLFCVVAIVTIIMLYFSNQFID